MSEALADATSMVDTMLRAEWRGPGDTRLALERLAERHKLPFAKLWALRYRPPKDVGISFYEQLCEAFLQYGDHKSRLNNAERAQTKARTGAGRALLRAAAALDRSNLPPLTNQGGV